MNPMILPRMGELGILGMFTDFTGIPLVIWPDCDG